MLTLDFIYSCFYFYFSLCMLKLINAIKVIPCMLELARLIWVSEHYFFFASIVCIMFLHLNFEMGLFIFELVR